MINQLSQQISIKTRIAITVLLCFAPIFIYWQVGFMQYTMKWDMMDQYFPFRHFIGECLSNGKLPWWNPYINLGYPFHADPQSSFWYPVTWLFAINGYSIYDLHAEFIFHLVVAGIGFYFLLKQEGVSSQTALLFSLCYQCCGFFVGNAQHFTYVIGAAWVPWIFFFFRNVITFKSKPDMLGCALCLNFLLTGGYPSLFIILNYLLVFLTLYYIVSEKIFADSKKLLLLVGHIIFVYVLFFILSSGYIVSFFESKHFITRGENISLERALFGAFPPEAMISLFFPLYTILKFESFHSDISMINGYLGMAGLIFFIPGLFVKSKLKWFWLLSGTFCLLTAFGEALPIREWLYYYVPLMDTFRFPSVFRLFFIIAVIIISASGFQVIIKHKQKFFSIVLSIGILSLLSFLIVKFINSIIHNGKFSLIPFWSPLEYHQFLSSHQSDDIFLNQSVIQIIVVLTLSVTFFIKNFATRYFLIALIIISDLFFATQLNVNGTIVCEQPVSEFQKAINKIPEGFSVNDNVSLNDMQEFERSFYPSNKNHSILLKTFSDEGYNPFLLKDYELFEKSPKRNDLTAHTLLSINNTENNIEIIKTEPNCFSAHTESESVDTLTLMQIYYPNWHAIINGQGTSIIKSDEGLMQIELNKGNNKIDFIYQPGKLFYLLLLQLLFQTGIILYLVIISLRRKGINVS
jgi:hypothetical protein